MSEPQPEIARAVVETRRRPSIVWLIPLVALVIGGWVAWRTYSERGPSITITMTSAEGLEAGKTKVKYKDVEVGLVETVTLAEDFQHVVVTARMAKEVTPLLTEKTRFWVVKARVAGGQVSGLGTLFSGAYIGMDPVRDAESTRAFRALDAAPIVTTNEPGRRFVLHSYHAGAVAVGTPVFFRKIEVGRVLSSELDPSGDFVAIQVFVAAPYDARVHEATRFWNASGIDVSVSADGVQVDTESVVSMLVGGIAFDTPETDHYESAPDGTVFPLYESYAATKREIYVDTVAYRLYFEQSVRGLHPGAPVEMLGIQLGEVRDVKLEVDPVAKRFRNVVVVEIEPGRIGKTDVSSEERRASVDWLVARGMRAQLKTGNLLTGQLLVSLDLHPEAPPATVAWEEPIPVFPTAPTQIAEITQKLTELVNKLQKLPIDRIGEDLRRTLATANGTLAAANAALAEAKSTLATTRDAVGPDSQIQANLQRTLYELSEAARSLGLAAEQVETEPESVIFGKEKN